MSKYHPRRKYTEADRKADREQCFRDSAQDYAAIGELRKRQTELRARLYTPNPLVLEPLPDGVAPLSTEVDRLTAERDEARANADAFMAHCLRLEARIAELTAGGEFSMSAKYCVVVHTYESGFTYPSDTVIGPFPSKEAAKAWTVDPENVNRWRGRQYEIEAMCGPGMSAADIDEAAKQAFAAVRAWLRACPDLADPAEGGDPL